MKIDTTGVKHTGMWPAVWIHSGPLREHQEHCYVVDSRGETRPPVADYWHVEEFGPGVGGTYDEHNGERIPCSLGDES